MDWDGNQEEIRKKLDHAECMVGDMVYEEDMERRIEMSTHIIRDIVDVLAKTETMSRWLRDYDEHTVTPLNEDGTFKILSYSQLVDMYKDLREDYRLLEKQIRGD